MGPELTESEILQIDNIAKQFHPKKSYSNFTSLGQMKYYYDRAIDSCPDQNLDEIKEYCKHKITNTHYLYENNKIEDYDKVNKNLSKFTIGDDFFTDFTVIKISNETK
jgi:hypothetical protein